MNYPLRVTVKHTHTNIKMILKRKVTGDCFSVLFLLVLSPRFLLNKGAMQFRSLPALESAGISPKTHPAKAGGLPQILSSNQLAAEATAGISVGCLSAFVPLPQHVL